MRYTTHIQLTVSASGIDHVCKGIKRGNLFCLMDEADEKLLAHYVGIHENVAVLCIAVVVLNGENTLLTVQVQDVAVQMVLLGIINGMIKHGHICTGFDMGIDQLGVVGGVDHVIRSDNNIRIMNCFDALQIGVVIVDICVIDIVDSGMLCKKDLEITALGVDVVVTSGSEMFYKRTGFVLYIDLNVLNSAVGHI